MPESHVFLSDLDQRIYLDYLRFVVERIHTVVVATVDDTGHPVTAAIDMMDCDEDGLLFLTARGKGFYRRLTEHRYLALTGMVGASTMERVAVSAAGEVREEGPQLLPRLFARNPYMLGIYPNEEARRSLTVMRLWRGSGEWFDLSKHPVERASFAWGGTADETAREPYRITDACISCGACAKVCPQSCIEPGEGSDDLYVIEQAHCLHCGACLEACPVGAVVRRGKDESEPGEQRPKLLTMTINCEIMPGLP